MSLFSLSFWVTASVHGDITAPLKSATSGHMFTAPIHPPYAQHVVRAVPRTMAVRHTDSTAALIRSSKYCSQEPFPSTDVYKATPWMTLAWVINQRLTATAAAPLLRCWALAALHKVPPPW